MNGCAIPYTPIAVDFWKMRQCPRVRLFFLSHAHLDQSCGITSSWSMPIYCSPLSKKLLILKFQINPEIINELDLDIPHTIPLSSSGDNSMTVTLVDANHCPGAVMFFFEGYFGRILYTGDFRYNEEMMKCQPFCDLISEPIDVLYLDNTFCSPKCVFPARDAAVEEILNIVGEHRNEKIVIGLRTLGKEELIISLANRYNTMVKVSEDRYKTLELLRTTKRFTKDQDADCHVEVVPLMQITRQNMDAWNRVTPTVAIIPTALFTALGFQPFQGQRDMFVVQYSDHSSYTELHRFVATVRPRSVIPIIKADVRDPLTASLLDRTSVECFLEYLDKSPMRHYHIPQSVLELMNQPVMKNIERRRQAKKRAARTRKTKEVASESAGSGLNNSEKQSSSNINISEIIADSCEDLEISLATVAKESPPVISTKVRCGISVVAQKSLKRAASTDQISAGGAMKAHVKMKLIRVSSPDLKIIDKARLCAELKRFHAGNVCNLMRSRRARLCSPSHCQTVCHESSDCCDYSSASDCLIEVNHGEETGFLFSPAEIVRDFGHLLSPESKRTQIFNLDNDNNIDDASKSSTASLSSGNFVVVSTSASQSNSQPMNLCTTSGAESYHNLHLFQSSIVHCLNTRSAMPSTTEDDSTCELNARCDKLPEQDDASKRIIVFSTVNDSSKCSCCCSESCDRCQISNDVVCSNAGDRNRAAKDIVSVIQNPQLPYQSSSGSDHISSEIKTFVHETCSNENASNFGLENNSILLDSRPKEESSIASSTISLDHRASSERGDEERCNSISPSNPQDHQLPPKKMWRRQFKQTELHNDQEKNKWSHCADEEIPLPHPACSGQVDRRPYFGERVNMVVLNSTEILNEECRTAASTGTFSSSFQSSAEYTDAPVQRGSPMQRGSPTDVVENRTVLLDGAVIRNCIDATSVLKSSLMAGQHVEQVEARLSSEHGDSFVLKNCLPECMNRSFSSNMLPLNLSTRQSS